MIYLGLAMAKGSAAFYNAQFDLAPVNHITNPILGLCPVGFTQNDLGTDPIFPDEMVSLVCTGVIHVFDDDISSIYGIDNHGLAMGTAASVAVATFGRSEGLENIRKAIGIADPRPYIPHMMLLADTAASRTQRGFLRQLANVLHGATLDFDRVVMTNYRPYATNIDSAESSVHGAAGFDFDL